MMKEAHKFTLLLLIIISLAFQLSYGNEINHLLSFKASIKDPTHALSNWNNSTPLCYWNGVTCSPSKTYVQEINLSSKNISGEISLSLFRLSRVELIDLSSNQLYGGIHVRAFSCLSLRKLNLSNNNLTGRVPSPVLGSGLETLDLSNNMLFGSFPKNLGWLLFLRYLDLGGNTFTGPIPRSISNLTNLEYLTLASNQLIGEIPFELGNLKKLKWIYLGYNKLSGQIPNEIGMLNSLYHLDLVYNNLSGPIPTSFGNLTSLQYLFLYQNNLNGTIPPSIAKIQSLVSLDFSDNLLNGEIPQNLTLLQNLQVFHLFSNNLVGQIPNSITLLPKLQVLQLWSNNLHGNIPKNLGKFNNLTILDLSTNSLFGKIPNYLCNSRILSKLILFSNSLEGEIPPSLGECHSLERIRLQNNSLFGELPKGFTKLKNVNFLDLSKNNFSGKIDHDSWNMLSLQMLNLGKNNFVGKLPDISSSVKLENLDLSENHFWGNIPPSYGNLLELMDLQLGRNQISGIIPRELCFCTKVVTLNLSHNRLSGPIPFGLGQMPVLGQLDLSDNQLSGMIPRNLGSVDSLVEVNVSYNHLYGALPPNGAFLAINLSDVAGNNLCDGDHLSNGLPPCRGVVKGPATTAMWWGLGASLGVAIMVVLGFVMCMLSYVKKRSNSLLQVQKLENEDGIWEVQFFDQKSSKLFSNKIHDIISKKNNKIMKNYNDDNMEFVVEEISVNNNLWEEVLEIGKIRHFNIVKILGACKGEKCGILIYEKVVGNCLSEVIHGLSWGSRRKIALGIARALKFLHYNCSPCILVGEMSPERVVVGGDDGEARVKLGVGGLFCLGPKSFLSSPYVAPETKDAKEITDKNDIYGFGLILIELLTGKGPMDSEFGGHGDIIGWARYCYSDCHLDTWIDPMIKEQRLNHQNEIVETMNMALKCTSSDPIDRPCSSDLVKNLECSFVRPRNCVLGMEIS
ncbi:hypothetical protein RND81_03G148200 [Saponaria officinalis]|uniref:Protein kinase domain-containing protein n=1 Tax=Saponaria officinalis TaxID=3572 RepID=A0AAW1M3X0_SAPOF